MSGIVFAIFTNLTLSFLAFPLQNAALQPATNGQTPLSANNAVQLKCNYCRGAFSLKPEVLEWEVRFFKNGSADLPYIIKDVGPFLNPLHL